MMEKETELVLCTTSCFSMLTFLSALHFPLVTHHKISLLIAI